MKMIRSRNKWLISTGLVMIFILLVKYVDVSVNPLTSSHIGLSRLNMMVKEVIGFRKLFDGLSDVLLLGVIGIVAYNLISIIRTVVVKKAIRCLKCEYRCMLVVYSLVVMVYIFFEVVVVNHRPILVDGQLEASFPSSHILLAVVVCGLNMRLKPKSMLYDCCWLIMLVLILTRFISGVHWLTDIIGSVLIGYNLVLLFDYLALKVNGSLSESP